MSDVYKPYRLRQVNDSGSFDIFHVETNTQMVLRMLNGASSGTLETTLTKIEGDISDAKSGISALQTAVAEKIDKVASPGNGGLVEVTSDGKLVATEKSIGDLAVASHKHAAGDITSGTLAVARGGTGVTTLVSLRENLGLGDSLGAVPISAGGTGAANAADARINLGITLGNLGVNVAATAINMLAGVESNVQEQIDAIKDQYVPMSSVGVASGVAPLDADGKVSAQFLPSYVDDVLEGTYVNTTTFNDKDGTPYVGETGKIYVDINTNTTYRWSGTVFARISEGVTLGTTASTAFRGDQGKAAYDHSQAAHARVDASKVAYKSNGVLTIDDTDTTVYAHPTYNKSDATAAANAEGTLTAITGIEESNGHVTKVTKTTFTLPTGGSGEVVSATQPTGQKAGDYWCQPL